MRHLRQLTLVCCLSLACARIASAGIIYGERTEEPPPPPPPAAQTVVAPAAGADTNETITLVAITIMQHVLALI